VARWVRFGLSVAGPFGCRCLTVRTTLRFHIPHVEPDQIPIRDVKGLIITPERSFAEAPPLVLLVVPGGFGQEELMDDEVVLQFMWEQAEGARYVFSVRTGALLRGAAGLLRGVRTTTHWSAFHLLGHIGAIPVSSRIVVDGKHVSAAGVTVGIDGALPVASLMRNERAAQ
jgi:cyclohexyl-isocyanide hydratase